MILEDLECSTLYDLIIENNMYVNVQVCTLISPVMEVTRVRSGKEMDSLLDFIIFLICGFEQDLIYLVIFVHKQTHIQSYTTGGLV